MMRLVALLLLALVPHFALACDRYTIEAIPFEYTHEDEPYEALTARARGVPTFGAVVSTATAGLKGCRLIVGWKDVRLSVASELRANRCAYEHVLSHERMHIRIFEEAAATLVERVSTLLQEKSLPEALNAFFDEVKARHAELDSPREYATNRTACHGAVLALVGLRAAR